MFWKQRPAEEHIEIIPFYNEIFIPSVKSLLVEVGPGPTTTRASLVPDTNNNNDAQCHGSPKVSTFPSLPEMSPKKVSAAHNVYVSPLRSFKMDAEHSSKSYCACVGECTVVYQSPSKDLTATNNCLNGMRKLRGTLSFDNVDVGLVSDSMMVNSLHLQNQNGSCASSSGAPVKTEQHDS